LLEEGDLHTVLTNTFEPYFEFSGNPEGVDEFLSKLGISGEVGDLDIDSLRRLTSALVLTLLKRGCLEAIDSIVGDRYYLKHEVIRDARRLVSIVNTCGKLEEPSVGFSLCLRDRGALEHALELDRDNRQALINTMKMVEQSLCEKEHLRCVILSDVSGTGAIAGTVTRYLFPDKPFIGLNRMSDIVKVSGRGTRKLVSQGLDLASALRSAAEAVGGVGGGHSIASGASIPLGCEEEFLRVADELIGKQLGGGV
jgi:hypothetical protein